MGWTTDSLRNSGAGGNYQQTPAAPMCTHGDGQLHQHVDGVGPRSGRLEPEQRTEKSRAICLPGSALIHQLNLVAFEYRNVDELAGFLSAMVFDDEQPRGSDFQHEAQTRNGAGEAPNVQIVSLMPHAQMNARPFDRQPRA